MQTKYQNIAKFLYEVGTLRKIARSHRQSLLTDDLSDNISSHSYRVTMIGWLLASLEKVDPSKVIMMCLLHDLPEARTGDQNYIHKKYIKAFEDEAINDQLSNIFGGKDMLKISSEYSQRKSKESLIAKDADLIDEILLEKEYAQKGNKEAESWLKGKYHIERLKTKSAKKLAVELISQNPSDWWRKGGWSSERRK